MSDNTHIEWTDASWNPIRANRSVSTDPDYSDRRGMELLGADGWHCERVSPGCQHCYAEALNEKRFGTGLPYNRRSRDLVEVFLHQKVLTEPLRWGKPRRVFVCSMADLFGEWVPDEMIDRVFAVMALSKLHTFQVLTKRPERMREYLSAARERIAAVIRDEGMTTNHLYAFDLAGSVEGLPDTVHGPWWPLPNVWLGVSAEDQERIPELLATPAAVRFLSCEPLLGPVDLPLCACGTNYQTGSLIHGDSHMHGIDWVIVGGESGPGARPCDVEWIRSIVRQCQEAHVACFVKQLGGRPYSETRRVVTGSVYPSARAARTYGEEPVILDLRDRKGGAMEEWPEDLRVREFPR